MKRVSFFIDGFNVYHSLLDGDIPRKFKWLDLHALCSRFIRTGESLESIYYFTALPSWDNAKKDRHIVYLDALRSKGVRIVEGRFKPTTKKIWVNQKLDVIIKSHEEKQSDVALGVEVIKQAYDDSYDTAVIVSADGDQIPAIKQAKTVVRPGRQRKVLEVLYPYNRHSKTLGRFADATRRIERKDIEGSQFPNPITIGQGSLLYMPAEWS